MNFLHLGELTFQMDGSLLSFLDGMESALEPGHPACKCRALLLQTRTEILDPALLFWILCG
jgi:hypothetical protein